MSSLTVVTDDKHSSDDSARMSVVDTSHVEHSDDAYDWLSFKLSLQHMKAQNLCWHISTKECKALICFIQ